MIDLTACAVVASHRYDAANIWDADAERGAVRALPKTA
jgi:hypothetical protein